MASQNFDRLNQISILLKTKRKKHHDTYNHLNIKHAQNSTIFFLFNCFHPQKKISTRKPKDLNTCKFLTVTLQTHALQNQQAFLNFNTDLEKLCLQF